MNQRNFRKFTRAMTGGCVMAGYKCAAQDISSKEVCVKRFFACLLLVLSLAVLPAARQSTGRIYDDAGLRFAVLSAMVHLLSDFAWHSQSPGRP